MSGPSSRSTHGSAPMWSSWPCVRTIASIASARCRRYSKSGSTRSMPSISAVGNIRPVSTTTIRPSYSTTVMFLPISPSPPRGRIFRAPLTWPTSPRRSPGYCQDVRRLERRADLRALLVGGLHERQAGGLGIDHAHHPQRSLDHGRRRPADRGRVEYGGKRGIDLVDAVKVAL